MTRYTSARAPLLLLLVLLLALAPAAYAQVATPVGFNTNTPATFTQPGQTLTFTLSVDAPRAAQVQVLSLSDGLAAAFDVVSPSGVVVATAANDGTLPLVSALVPLGAPGTYTIRVRSASSATGDILLTVLASAGAVVPPVPLALDASVEGSLDGQTPLRGYSAQGSASEPLVLLVRATRPDVAPLVTLKDAATNEVLALVSARLGGARFVLPPLVAPPSYTLELSNGGNTLAVGYTVCFTTERQAALCDGGPAVAVAPTVVPAQGAPALPPTATFAPLALDPNGPCAVATLGAGAVNVRQGPSTTFAIVASLPPTQSALVIGRLADNTWLQVNRQGVLGWVAGTVVRVGGQCGGVPVVVPPTLAAPSGATATPTPIGTPPDAATLVPTAVATLVPTPVPTLNFSLPTVFGSIALTSGFVPDPRTAGVTAGGPANPGYLGGACRGHMTVAPSFSVNYTAGAFPLLRFYFVGSADTTMVINTPSGSYVCADDSFGTVHPTLDFNSPASGRYDVWVGTFAPGASVGGTLFITENSGNRP